MYSHLSSNIRPPVLDSGWINVPRSDVDVKRVDESRPPSLGLLLNPNHQTEYYDRVAASLLKIPTTFKHPPTPNGASADQFTQTEPSNRNTASGQSNPNFAHSKGSSQAPQVPTASTSGLEQSQQQCNMNTKVTAGGVTMANPGVVIATSSATDDKCYRLDMCGQQFSYNYALMNQMSFPYKCDLCGVAFVNSSVLNQHKRIHNDKTYSCKCGALFPSNSELKTHQATVHKDAQQPDKKECEVCGNEIVNKPNRKRFQNRTKCQSCIDDYLANQGLKPKYQRRPNGIKKCESCNGSGIVYDGSRSDKPFQCNVCDNTFSRYSSLWSHKRLHSGDKPYRCDECGTGFAKAAYLKNHKRVHTGEKPFKCTTCGQEFSQGPHLKNHERIHTGERPYTCEVCGKRFSRHSTLWNHRRIHTGEKPYRCDVCGSSFSQGTHLKNHRKVHTGERPYRCDVCDVGFSDRFALKRHRNVHGSHSSNPMATAPTLVHPTDQPEPSTAPSLVDLYKCEVGQVAFPGCARPPDDEKPIHT